MANHSCTAKLAQKILRRITRSLSRLDGLLHTHVNPNKMHMLQSLFYLTSLHVSGVTITNFQEHKITVTTASGNRYTVLFSAAILEEMETCREVVR